MADNVVFQTSTATYPPTTLGVATDKVTYSGDADRDVQLVRFVQVTGAEGSKTVVNLPGDATDGLLVNLGTNNDVTVTSGTVAATQSGAWTITANAGTGTFAVSAASLPLPTGAATAAKQPALGTAGTASADVLTVQGIASMTALKVDGSGVTQPVSIASAVPVNDGGGSLTVDNGGTFAVQVSSALPAGSNAIGKLAANSGVTIGAVELAASQTLATVSTVTTVTTVSAVTSITNTVAVAGVAAHDAAASGNPLLNGAIARRARSSAVSADADAVTIAADRYGRLATVGVALSVATLDATASGDTDVIAAPGAGNRLKVLRVEASNTHATTALTVSLKSASLNGGSAFGKKYLPAAGGLGVWVFPSGYLEGGDNEKLTINLSGAGTVSFTVYYETIAS